MNGTFTAADTADELHSLFINGMQHGADTGWSNLDEKVSFEPGRFVVVTGRPGEGKSEWIDELVLRLCQRHEWRIAYFSPENMPIILHQRKLAEKLTGFPFEPAKHMTEELYEQVTHWLADNVTHILPEDEDGYTLDNILTIARQLVARRGVRILVLDPLNRIEQKLEQGQTELQYLSSLLNRLVRFAQQHRVLVILVAHPRKVNRNEHDGRRRRVEMNDINGSADFGNKADYCFVVDRNDDIHMTTIYIDKVRFKHLGNRGAVRFRYDVLSGRFTAVTAEAVTAMP
jgi:twinkle protein